MPGQAIVVDVVSDVVCPWCYIGKRRLEKAAALRPQYDLTVRWRPFQLAPDLPPEGEPRADYLIKKFGGEDRAKEMFERVRAAGLQDGLDLRFDRIEVAPNTLNAHRLILWAGTQGVQDAVVEALFRAYFVDGRNLADVATLIEIGAGAGLDAEILTPLFNTDSDVERVSGDVATAHRLGIHGVPFFIVAGAFGASGAEDPERLAGLLDRAAEAAEPSPTP